MKRNKALRTVSILLVLLLVSTCAFSGSLAKYVGAASGASWKTRVGAFRVLVNDVDITGAAGATLTLTTTLQELDEGNVDTETAETHAQKATESVFNGIYVPGSGYSLGKEGLTVVNYSEVDVNVKIELISGTDTSSPTGLFSTDNSTWKTWSAISSDLATVGQELKALNTGRSTDDLTTLTLYHKWDFEGASAADSNDNGIDDQDDTDNALGIAAATALFDGTTGTVKSTPAGTGVLDLKFKITVTQVD
jgi:hypothetical protein